MSSPKSIESKMTCPIPGGFLVAFEGIDGSGKTTQAELLAKFCSENRFAQVVSKEPTKGKYGMQIRDSATHGRMSIGFGVDNITNRTYFLFHPFPQRTFVGDLKFSL